MWANKLSFSPTSTGGSSFAARAKRFGLVVDGDLAVAAWSTSFDYNQPFGSKVWFPPFLGHQHKELANILGQKTEGRVRNISDLSG